MRSFLLLAAVAAVARANLPGATFPGFYKQTAEIIGEGFYKHFAFENISDPTHGRVTYVDKATAIAQNLTYAHGGTFILRTDAKTVLTSDGPGRNSVRLHGVTSYTRHVAVFDVAHMPQGCGTWPAIWELGLGQWPNGGEIDIVEGVNDQAPNLSSLHTSANCSVSATPKATGHVTSTNCDVAFNFNQGCGVQSNKGDSYGPTFNQRRGGFFALERTDEFIRVWFWERNDWTTPLEVQFGLPIIDTDTWGKPYAYWTNDTCDLKSKFGPANIIINLTLCGDWAGNVDVFASAACAPAGMTCKQWVEENPAAFKDAYWQFNSARVYE